LLKLSSAGSEHPDFQSGGSLVRTQYSPPKPRKFSGFFIYMHFLYIIYSQSLNKFYVGSTSDDLNERLRKHNSNYKGFTGGKGDWEIKYLETLNTKKEALAREKAIKSWKSRKLIEKLIAKT